MQPIALFHKKNYNIAMEKRDAERIKVNLRAERISGNAQYGVFIENISEKGIQIIATTSREHKKYIPGTDLDLKFRLSSRKTLSLRCRVRWIYSRIPPDGLTDSIGLEVINPPPEYAEFVKSLR
jgi:hypothetical protein